MFFSTPIRLSLFLIALMACSSPVVAKFDKQQNADIQVGAASFDAYLPKLKGKKVALVINQTSSINGVLLLDTLVHLQVNVVKVFVPEHGFRGTADAGTHIQSEVDAATGLPVISLYGKNKKPSKEQLADVDVVVYDLQDVGVRFYTYISTLEYVMDACIAEDIPLIVLDRPNPNAHVIDGPVLDTNLRSFVGMQPIPIVYGMTVAEYATMLQGEHWIKDADRLQLTCIPCKHYTHHKRYALPIAPSPNLKTMTAVYLYPSLCFFEGTIVSLGRGTDKPFQQWGHPDYIGKSTYQFTPKSVVGASKPLLENQICYGRLVAENPDEAYALTASKMDLSALLTAYQWSPQKSQFFTPFFEKLAGTRLLRQQIIEGKTEVEIRASWQADLHRFKQIRQKYLHYAD
jgi:uncharacterized protein YbbC (DUF1343 family)